MLFYLPISVSSSRRDADEEEKRDDPDESDVEVEKRFLPIFSAICKKTKKC
uniref:Brevinin-1SHb n=1 Tax=Pelophylax saharicus TaxID=70019 RepID=D5GRW7_PELSA|nr:brevinin-1SHb precursor [Pelophylax saharicus]